MGAHKRKQKSKPQKDNSSASMDSGPGSMPSAPSPGSAKLAAWIMYSISSGLFAALNGVFAKLTTTTQLEYTSTPALSLLLRGIFFSLNLITNAIMWFLFTRALTSANSSTRVTVIGTSANFLLTAILGLIIFKETLPLGWWGGATLLVVGSVIIGARDGQDEGKIVLGDDEDGVALATGVGAAPGAGGLTEQLADQLQDPPGQRHEGQHDG